jgi:membrane-associated phospholipid phosphatase
MAALAAHEQAAQGVKTAVPSELNGNVRRTQAFQRRVSAAVTDKRVPVPSQGGNSDEAAFPNGIANFTKGLGHNQFGEVDPHSYALYQLAISTGQSSDFDAIPTGANTPLVDPQAGLAFDLEGVDVAQLEVPPAPAFSSAARAAEAVEVYWLAVARDVPFSQYGNEPTTEAAIEELNRLPAYAGPKDSGSVTAQSLFRGFTAGDQVGPYVSQLLLQPFSYGPMPLMGYKTDLPLGSGGADYLIDTTSWLKCENGQGPFANTNADPTLRYPRTGRDLAAYVHVDVLYQEYLNAALALVKMKAPLNSGNPYDNLKSETGFITFGLPHAQVLIAEVAARALKHVWYEKWFVQRLIRPEEFGGRLHFTLFGDKNYPIDPSVLNSQALKAIFQRNGTYLLPMAYPEGCPQHPSYPQAHATVAGACATVLKWFFSDSFVIPNPLVANEDGSGVTAYTGSDAGELTVGGEINKLASNVGLGRMFAGVHWRADYMQGLLLGEAAAISVLKDQEHLYSESFTGFTFTKFDGTTITV